MRGLGQGDNQVEPHILRMSALMGFTYCKAQEKSYCVPNYVDHHMYEWQNSYAYTSIVEEF
jgi:hypothetical protein